LLYDDDITLEEKLETIATQVYGASSVTLEDAVRADLERLQSGGYGHLPICVAKTPQSLSADARRVGAPEGFTIPIRELRLSAGAGFVVALAGKVLTMPGLPSHPAARDIFVNEQGAIEGLR
jgi:formate--tetrahydrofolate ligase